MDIYVGKGLAASTQRSYGSGVRRYEEFCRLAALPPLSASEKDLSRFVAHLASNGLTYRTIKVYLAGIRFARIKAGLPNMFSGAGMPKLEYVLKGVRRAEAEQGKESRQRLPITPDILMALKAVWALRGGEADTKMLWAAVCVGFFAFLRAGEMTVPSEGGYDPEVHLNMGDVAVDDPREPTLIQLRIKQSKTDPFRLGVKVVVGRTGTSLCPVAALLDYLRSRGTGEGPLFRYQDGRCLTRQRLVVALREGLSEAGIEQEKYCSHSLRIGAATTAAKKGMGDAVIKTLGRWESVAYQQYVRIPSEQLASYSAVLAS